MKKNLHIISKVLPDSIGEELELEPGDALLSINGKPVEDVFDYRYLMNDEFVKLLIRKKNGEEWELEVENTVIGTGAVLIHKTVLKLHAKIIFIFLFYFQFPFLAILLSDNERNKFVIHQITIIKHIISRVLPDSIGEELELEPGDALLDRKSVV